MKLFASLAPGLALIFIAEPSLKAYEIPTVRAIVKSEKERRPAPSFELKDASGQAVKLSDYRGRVLLLNFWATWCGGCKLEIPWFQEFETSLGLRRFAVLGVSVDEKGWDVVKPFIEKSKVTYKMVLSDKSTLESYGIKALPATFIIDGEGRIAAAYLGVVDKSDIENNLRTVGRE